MKKTATIFILLVMAAFAIPIGISGISTLYEHNSERTESAQSGAIQAGSFDTPFTISVYMTDSGKVENRNFEEYIEGVLAGEMPPTYNSEALCAQAVAARSYILSKAEAYFKGQTAPEHNGAMICTNPNHCKAWRDLSAAKAQWDVRYADDYEAKIKAAAKRTEGEYMTYDGKVVKAFFYAMSSGRTENVEDVWGAALPYLRSVDSREDSSSDGFESMSTFTVKSLCDRLHASKSDFSGTDSDMFISEISRTDGGSVREIKIGNTVFKGTQIREILGLKSANFSIELNGKKVDECTVPDSGAKVTFRVKGYGHGVGMSQNGANVLAGRGMKYRDILKHYYTGVSIVNLYKKA